MSRWIVLGAVVLLGCEERAVRYPPSAGPAPPGAVAAPTSALSAGPALPPPPTVTFARGPEIRFESAAPPKLTPLTKQFEVLAVSPAAGGYVAMDGQLGRIVSDARPDGWPFEAAASTRARYAPDGAHVAIWDHRVTVYDTRTGKKIVELDGAPCDLRFASASELVYHTGSLGEVDNQVVRYRLGGGPARLGPKRMNRACSGSSDGAHFIVSDPGPVRVVDAHIGAERVLWNDDRWDTVISPNGDRVCVSAPNTLPPSALICVRARDLGQEIVIPQKTSPMYATVIFDPTGARAFVGHSIEDPESGAGIRHEALLVDFATQTVRPVIGHEPKSGAVPALMPGGVLLVQGSSRGVMVYDLERGSKHFAAKSSLYGATPILHERRRFIADREIGAEWAESYYVDVP